MKVSASRVPCAIVAGAVAIAWATFAKRPVVILSIRRSKSSGRSERATMRMIATPAIAAGIRVTLSGAPPGRTPVRSSTPNTTRASR